MEVDRWAATYGRMRRSQQGASFCPLCLGDPDPFWRTEWTEPLRLVCRRHRVLLVDVCPTCGKRPFGPHSSWSQRISPAWMCPSRRDDDVRIHRTRREWCRTDLRAGGASVVSDAQLDAVEHLDHALEAAARDPGGPTALWQWTTTSTEYAHALLELIDEQVRANRWAHASSRELVTAIDVASQVMTAASPEAVEAIAARHGVLDPVGTHTPIAPKEHDYHPRSSLLVSLRLASLARHLSLGQQLMFRTASGRPRPPVRTERRDGPRRLPEGTWPARGWVPPALWAGELTDHVSVDESCGRAALSLALSKVGSSIPLRAIALDLGLPAWLADRIAKTLSNRTRNELERLTADLERLFSRLEAAPPPIDYSHRVAVGRDLATVRAAAVEAASFQSIALDEAEEVAASVALWVAYTGSHPRFCPLPLNDGLQPPWPSGLNRAEFLDDGFLQLPHDQGEPMAWWPP